MGAIASEVAASGVPVVELAGPAGAGKSTVMSLLRGGAPDASSGGHSTGRTHRRTAALALRSAGDWFPVALSALMRSPLKGRELVRHVVRLRTMQDELPTLRSASAGVLLLDEGPVLSLAKISRACEVAGSAGLRRYCDSALAVWAESLHMVVYLDAVDPVLAGRINERRKHHAVKGLDSAQVRSFLTWYRRHYSSILDSMSARGVQVVHMDTSTASAADVAKRVDAMIGGLHVR